MIFTYYPNDFWHKRKKNIFDPYNVFLAISTNIVVLLKTVFFIQGHIWQNMILRKIMFHVYTQLMYSV